MKTCTKCKRSLPKNLNHFHKNKQSPDGLRNRCKECRGMKFTNKNLSPTKAKEGFKTCSECNRALPMNRDYYYTNRDCLDGYTPKCKECTGTKFTHKVGVKEGYKVCIKCNDVLYVSSDNFPTRKETLDGHINRCRKCTSEYDKKYRFENRGSISFNMKAYHNKNKAILNAVSRQYYKDNKDRLLEMSKKWYRENRCHVLKQKKEYYLGNRDTILKQGKKYYYKNTSKLRERRRFYCKNNPHIIRQATQRRRARLKELPHTLTVKEWENTLQHFNNECSYCGMNAGEHLKLYNQQLHQDHVIPLSKDGGYIKYNIIPSCKTCNLQKKDKDLIEWYTSYKYYSETRLNEILEFIRQA